MLPHLCGMEAFSISLPQSWQSLTDRQLRYFFRLVARDLPLPEVLALCAARWANITMLGCSSPRFFWVKDKRTGQRFQLAHWQWTFAARQLAFLESFSPWPVRLATVQGAEAVAADLQGVPFESYLALENFYQGFLHTQRMDCLGEMAQLLYPTMKGKLTRAELLSVFYWFASVKDLFTRSFPHFFTFAPTDGGNLLGDAAQGLGDTLRQAMNAQIRALTGGDITKEQSVLAMDCWRALTELDAKAREAEEIKRMQ